MPLSRAQLLAGDNNTGIPTLAGQVQGVTAGSGITISSAGVLSVDASTITGVVKTNNSGAFNSYVWPGSDGAANTYLKTNGSGILSWEPVSGFSVVVVQSGAPTSPDVGELWFDCATGTLNVYQDCVGSPTPNWFNVAQPGLPVLPGSTSASPAFTPGGAGTQANPYVCTVTTTGPGTTVYVVNTVTITGLAPFQYVPIVDLNAVTNGGRFTFSNYYANAAGTLVFQTIFSDLPASPPASNYTAAIRVGYSSVYVNAVVNIVSSFYISSPGSISGLPQVGQTLTYTKGTYSGGTLPVTESWIWKDSGGATLASNVLTYAVTAAEAGKSIFVEYKVVDSSAPPVTLTANTPSTAPVFQITSPGSVSGTPAVGQTLTYTTGTYVGGASPVLATWKWKDSSGNVLASNTPTYTITSANANKNIYVEYTVSDASTPPQTLTAPTPSTSPVLAITSAGSISGTANVGQVLTYTQGTYSGGLAPVVETWKWKDSSGNILASNVPTYTITASEAGKTIYVEYTATDSSTPAAALSANTASTATVTFVPFPGGVWSPTPPTGLNVSPGLISGLYNGTSPTITPTGCIEVSTDGVTFVKSPATLPIVGGTDTLYARWVTTPAGSCGDSPTVTNISGSVSDGTYINPYNLAVSRIPSPAIGDLTDGPVPLIATVTKAISSPIAGLTATAYVTYVGTSTGSAISASTDNVTFTPLATSGQGFPVVNGQTLYIRQTVGSAISTGYTAIIRVGDGTNTAGTYGEFTYTATTTSSAAFPNVSISPSTGPNASPAGISIPAETLEGTASGTWPAAPSAETSNPFSVTSTGALLFSQNGNPAGQGPSSFVLNDTIDLVWDEAVVDATADGGSVSGDLVGAPYTNSYSMTIDRTPDAFTLTALSGEPVSSQVDSETVNIAGINVPTFLTYTAGSPNSLTNPFVSINNGPQVAIPSSGNTLKVSPGDSVEFFADTGATAPATYTITFNMGSLSVPWSVATAVGPTVVQPSITTPANNATGINPTSVFPYGVTLTGSAYATTGGAGAHTSSDWKLYSAIPYQAETTGTISNVQVVGPATTLPMANWSGVSLTGVLNTYNLVAVTGGNGIWITSSAYSGGVFISLDNGASWTQTTGPFIGAGSSGSASTLLPASLAFGNNLYVAGSSSAAMSYSTDGVVWTTVGAGASAGSMNWVEYGGGQWVTYGQTSGRSYTSPDAITWTQRNTVGSNMKDGFYGGGLWISVGTAGKISSSPDGITWTVETSGTANNLNSVTYGNALWVAVGDSNTLLTSPDGVAWSSVTSPMTGTSNNLSACFGDGIFVIGNSTGQMATSTDGVTWTLISAGSGAGQSGFTAGLDVTQIAFFGGQFMAVGETSRVSTTTSSYLTLTFTNNTGFSNFSTGYYVNELGGGNDGLGTIRAIRSGSSEIDLGLYGGTWDVNSKLIGASASSAIIPGAPTTNPPSSTYYTQVVNVTGDTSNLTSYFVPVASLALNTTYYAQVAYTSSDPITSSPSAWSKFSTAKSFIPASTAGNLRTVNVLGTIQAAYLLAPNANSTATVSAVFTNPTQTGALGGSSTDGSIYGGDTLTLADASGKQRPVAINSVIAPGTYNVYGQPLVSTTGVMSMNRNLSSKLTLSAGEFVLFTAPLCPMSNVVYATTTTGGLWLAPTSTSAVAGQGASGGWRQISYTLPGSEKIVQMGSVNSGGTLNAYAAKVVVLSNAGNLYAVGTNGATADFGFPDTGTWASPTQITGISNVTAIVPSAAGRGLSAVTAAGDLWFGASSSGNMSGGDFTFQQVGTGALSPLWPTDTTPLRYLLIKQDGLYYTKTTAFVGGGADVFTLLTYGAVPQNPVYNFGTIPYQNSDSALIITP